VQVPGESARQYVVCGLRASTAYAVASSDGSYRATVTTSADGLLVAAMVPTNVLITATALSSRA
jgi:hypothetical protein